MPEKTKQEESSVAGSYYYDDATGYEPFDPDAPDDDDEEEVHRELSDEVDDDRSG